MIFLKFLLQKCPPLFLRFILARQRKGSNATRGVPSDATPDCFLKQIFKFILNNILFNEI